MISLLATGSVIILYFVRFLFLADRTNCRAIGTLCFVRLSVVVCLSSVTLCIVA